MHKKRVNMSIFCNKTPFEVKIYCQNGVLITQKYIAINNSVISFCTHSKRLIIVANFNGNVIKKILCLSNCCCQNVFTSFNFFNQIILPNTSVQNFLLIDANYNLPIDAILSFKG